MILDTITVESGGYTRWAVAASYALLLVLETAFPLRKRTRPRAGRYVVNAVMSAVVFIVGGSIVRVVGLGLSGWAGTHGYGILNMTGLPPAARFGLGFLLMDLTFYYWHRANHEAGILWRFHNVHHCDPDMDVTTSFRFHFVEVFYSTGFRAIQVLVTGVSPATYVIYEVFFACETVFHHSNLKLPVGVERALNKVIVTPRMHGIHHSCVEGETNSNYGTIFRWWDALHGSLNLGVPQSEVIIGVPGYARPEDNRLAALTAMPLARQRDYWTLSGGTIQTRPVHDKTTMME